MNILEGHSYRYVGNPGSCRRKTLKGKTALLRIVPHRADRVLAQFDDITTGLAHGWHNFPTAHFAEREDRNYEPTPDQTK